MKAPQIGFVSLGCPKALVDSKRIITKLRATGYQVSADLLVANTCGFIDAAVEESLESLGEAAANALAEETKEQRLQRFMVKQAAISAQRLQQKIGKRDLVIIDEVVEEGAVGRSRADAAEIDGQVFIDHATHLRVGDFVEVEFEAADEHELWARLV